jgi:hypothetical protein
VGIDLLALCQRVTADGSVTSAEAKELSRWLEESASIAMPAIGHLRATVQRILEDGVVTQSELQELHRAVERVMPPEQRIVSEAVRKDREQTEKTKRRPLARLDSMVAGLTFEGRAYVVHKHAVVGDPLFLVRDRNNPHSRAAIEVRLSNGMQVGFVPDVEAQGLAPLLDRGAIHIASIKKIWPGRRVDVPIIEAAFYEADSGIAGFAEKDCPVKTAIPASYLALAETVMRNPDPTPQARNAKSQGCGCVTLILAIIILSSVAAVAAIR